MMLFIEPCIHFVLYFLPLPSSSSWYSVMPPAESVRAKIERCWKMPRALLHTLPHPHTSRLRISKQDDNDGDGLMPPARLLLLDFKCQKRMLNVRPPPRHHLLQQVPRACMTSSASYESLSQNWKICLTREKVGDKQFVGWQIRGLNALQWILIRQFFFQTFLFGAMYVWMYFQFFLF